jgi:hypothetical protein
MIKSKEEILARFILEFPATDEMTDEKIKHNVYKAMEAYHSQSPSQGLREKMEELWDKYSEHIDDDIDSLQTIAGSTVLTESNFKKLISELTSIQK